MDIISKMQKCIWPSLYDFQLWDSRGWHLQWPIRFKGWLRVNIRLHYEAHVSSFKMFLIKKGGGCFFSSLFLFSTVYQNNITKKSHMRCNKSITVFFTIPSSSQLWPLRCSSLESISPVITWSGTSMPLSM